MVKCSILSVSFIRDVSIVVVECACGKKHNYRIPSKENPCPPPAAK